MQDFYEVLGIEKGASQAQIRAAYKRLAKQYHPDHNPGNKEAEETFKVINEAYHTLSDPQKKLRYDSRFEWVKEEYNEVYWQEVKRKRYEQWKQSKDSYYRLDRNYFKIQGLAFLVFLIMAGFCFGIIHTAHYYVDRQHRIKWNANSQLLTQVNGLFGQGRFDDAFAMIHVLEEKDPLEYRFIFAKDSLVGVLRKISDTEFEKKNFESAVLHYQVLQQYEHPIRFETLENISMCQYYLGNFKESIQALKHLHNQQPDNLNLIYQIGYVNLTKLNNAEEALHYFTLGKKLFKSNLGSIYGKAFEIVMDPADAPNIYFHIFHARAEANLRLKRYTDAVTDCNWAIFLRPLQGEPYHQRAIANIRQRKLRDVCDDIDRAVQLGVQEAQSLQGKYCASAPAAEKKAADPKP
jgi:tetratricopeptide (TPR) repeat protein